MCVCMCLCICVYMCIYVYALDKAVFISHSTDTLQEGMHPAILPSTIVK